MAVLPLDYQYKRIVKYLYYTLKDAKMRSLKKEMAPRVVAHPGTRTTKGHFMATPKSSAPDAHRTTRHPRVDDRFLELLEEDFGISVFTLSNAFMSVPAEPKKSAIRLCEWAARTDDPTRTLLAWARKNGRGTFRPDVAGDEERRGG
jgi:hypothetical protein